MSFRDFDAARREHEGEPVRFKLAGDTFTCLPVVPVRTALLIDQATSAAAAYVDFIAACLIEADRDRFRLLLSTTADEVTFDEVMEVAAWVGEQLTGRPTTPSDASAAGSSDGGQPSSVEPAATASPSPPG